MNFPNENVARTAGRAGALGSVIAIAVGLIAFLPLPAKAQTDASEISGRLARIEAMSEAEKSELLKNQARFSQLSKAEKDQLRGLQRDLQASPEREQLEAAMQQYSQWLASLTTGQRAEIRSLPTKERIDRVRELVSIQQREQLKTLANVQITDEDLEHLKSWAKNYLTSRSTEFMKLVPREFLPRVQNDSLESKYRALMFIMYRRVDDYPFPIPSEEELADLMNGLSAPAVASLHKIKQPREQTRLALQWIRVASYSRSFPTPNEDELQRFYKKHLSSKDREELDGLSAEDLKSRLLEIYRQHLVRRKWNDMRPGGRPRSGNGNRPPPGGPRPPGPNGKPPERRKPPGDDS